MPIGVLNVLQWPKSLNAPLNQVDPELYDIIEHEKNRQWKVGANATPLLHHRQGRLCGAHACPGVSCGHFRITHITPAYAHSPPSSA
jgi:hypothetical protein